MGSENCDLLVLTVLRAVDAEHGGRRQKGGQGRGHPGGQGREGGAGRDPGGVGGDAVGGGGGGDAVRGVGGDAGGGGGVWTVFQDINDVSRCFCLLSFSSSTFHHPSGKTEGSGSKGRAAGKGMFI